MSYSQLSIHPLSNIQSQNIQSSENVSSLNSFMTSAFASDTPQEKRRRNDDAFLEELESKRLPMDIEIDKQNTKLEKKIKKLNFNIEEEDKNIKEEIKKKGRPKKKDPLPQHSSQQLTRSVIAELTPIITKRGYRGISDTQLEAMKKEKLTKRKALYKKGYTVMQLIALDNDTLNRLYEKYK
jgi:hypothetical protein